METNNLRPHVRHWGAKLPCQLNAKNVPANDRFLIIHANGLANLLSEEQATSVDYVSARALMSGAVDQYMGFTVIVMGDMDEGGLSIDGSSDRTCYAIHKWFLNHYRSLLNHNFYQKYLSHIAMQHFLNLPHKLRRKNYFLE